MQNTEALSQLKNFNGVDLVKKGQAQKNREAQYPDFKSELDREITGTSSTDELKVETTEAVKFSKHAVDRISARGINLTESEISSLNQALSRANDKGIKDSLVMLNDTAFILSVRNKTVITAIDKENFKEKVITNIDGVVIL